MGFASCEWNLLKYWLNIKHLPVPFFLFDLRGCMVKSGMPLHYHVNSIFGRRALKYCAIDFHRFTSHFDFDSVRIRIFRQSLTLSPSDSPIRDDDAVKYRVQSHYYIIKYVGHAKSINPMRRGF